MEYDIEKILQTYEDDYNPDPRPMDQGPRIPFGDGLSVDPERDSFKKISNVIGAYNRYRRGEKNPALNFNQFFELYSTENFAEGGRTGYYQGGTPETIQPEYDYDSADIGPGGYPLTANLLSKTVLPEGLKPAKKYVIGLLNKIKPYGVQQKV